MDHTLSVSTITETRYLLNFWLKTTMLKFKNLSTFCPVPVAGIIGTGSAVCGLPKKFSE